MDLQYASLREGLILSPWSKGEQPTRLDFGYMDREEPREHDNNDGLATPLLHGVERVETRCFFDFPPCSRSNRARFSGMRRGPGRSLIARYQELRSQAVAYPLPGR